MQLNPHIVHPLDAQVHVILLAIVVVTTDVKKVAKHGVLQNVHHKLKTQHHLVLVVAIFVMDVQVFAKEAVPDPVKVHPIKVTNNDKGK